MKYWIELLLGTYWNQVLIIIGIIGFFGRYFWELKAKKREQNHSIFQDKKMSAIQEFFISLKEYEEMIRTLSIIDVFTEKINVNDIDNHINPALFKLDTNVKMLEIFLTPKEFEIPKRITINGFELNRLLQKLYHSTDESLTVQKKMETFNKEFSTFRNDNLKELSSFAEIVRKNFKL